MDNVIGKRAFRLFASGALRTWHDGVSGICDRNCQASQLGYSMSDNAGNNSIAQGFRRMENLMFDNLWKYEYDK